MNTVKILYGSWSELYKLNLSINHYGERLLKDLLAKLEMLMTRFEIRNLTTVHDRVQTKRHHAIWTAISTWFSPIVMIRFSVTETVLLSTVVSCRSWLSVWIPTLNKFAVETNYYILPF